MIDAMLAKSYVLGMTLRPLTGYDQDWELVCMLCVELPTLENGLARIELLEEGGEGSVVRVVLIVALVGWTTVARLVRDAALSVREREFVRAALAPGTSPARIMVVHVLPGVTSPIVVAATLSVDRIILTAAVLSFLGHGIQPPLADWGSALANAQELIWQAPQLAAYPGLLIFVTVIAFRFLGDGLQDVLDPRAAGS